MRIAFFVHRFPVVSETFILRQVSGLIDLGHEVDVYSERAPEDNQPLHPEFNQYGLRSRTTYLDAEMPAASGYWSMPVWPFTGETWLPGAEHPIRNVDRILEAVPVLRDCLAKAPELTVRALDPGKYGEQAVSLEALYHLHSLLRRTGNYDVLHAHFGPVANRFRFARDIWRVPFVVTFHGYDYCTVPREHGPCVYEDLFLRADAVTIHSDYGRKRLEAIGCPPDRLCRLHVGLDPLKFPYHPRVPAPGVPVRILTVARLVEIKGVRFAIEAVAKVHAAGQHIRYDVVGDGPERPALEAQIRQLGLEAVVRLHGAQNTRRVSDLMAQADLFVLPSINLHGDEEGTPVSLMEAQASGLPVVASATGGISEVIRDGQSGFLFPERDVAALADRLLFLIHHSDQWPGMGARGREHVERNFDIRRLSHQLIAIYEDVITQTRGRVW